MRGFIKCRNVSRCLAIVLVLAGFTATAQNPARKNLSPKHSQYYDSLQKMNYDRMFPIWGDKVYKRGFDIPFPFGIMLNSFYCKQGIEISNIHIGLESATDTLGPADLSNVIKFSDVTARAYNLNLRADVWVFPFLNVYAMLNYFPQTKTAVTLSEPVVFSTEAKQSGWAYGFGILGAGGVGPVWLQADYNVNWADMQLLKNKVFTQVVGMRMGHVFPLKSDAQKNISVWIGAMGVFLNSGTVGRIAISDLTDMSQDKVDKIKQSYSDWYDDLPPLNQKIVDKIMEKLQDRIDGKPVGDSYITYQLDKKPASSWAGLMGIQFQFSKRWQLRMESNFLGGDRFSLLTSINYRWLGIRKKTPASN